ncbi:Stringent starvation protein B [hydrothermal vent metagenome]|uniref:Stringent starvation protein B n=1 Tax=hydrothermal vent metagenome TaxID=652676 RepID=A0A3B0WJA3_9ZZZZ
MQMTSSRPYLIRAMYQWIADNGMTPHLLVDVSVDGVQVPTEHVQNGKIILNIAPMAISSLVLGDAEVTFSARFSGKTMELYIPIDSVLALYAKENGQGMMFSEDDGAISAPDSDNDDDPDPDKPKRPSLRVVK